MKVTLRVDGGAQLARAFRTLPEAVSNRVLKAALLQAAEPTRATAASLVTRAGGHPDIADNIVAAVAKREEPGDVVVVVGPTSARRSDDSRPFSVQGAQLELGNARQQAQPFLRPAFETQQQRAIQTLQQLLWAVITKHLVGQGSRGQSTGVGV